MIDQDTGEIIYSGAYPNITLRAMGNYDYDAASRETELICPEPTLAQQEPKDDCDINTIVERFGLTGHLPEDLRVPINADFDEILDYHTAANRLLEADDAFMQMPAAIRERFGNSAGAFVDFVSDPKNVDQCREWGLATPKTAPQGPIEVRVIPDPKAESK